MNAFFEPGVFSGGFFKAGSSGGGFAVPALDPAVDSGLAPKTLLAIGPAKFHYNHSGPTMRLQRSSDSAQSDFGFDSNGLFDRSAVDSWRSAADVTAAKFYDQSGTGKEVIAKLSGSASPRPFITSNAYTCCGNTFNTSDGSLTLSGTDGLPLVEISSGGYLELTTSGLSMTNGMEVHMITVSKNRKVEQNNTTDPMTNDKTGEAYFSYGLSPTNNMLYELSSGNYLYRLRRIGTGAGGTDQSLSSGGEIKKNAVVIVSACVDNNIRLYARGQRPIDTATSAGNQTANTATDNGTLRIGRRYPGSSGESTNQGNFYFGGLVITKSLTDFERFKLHARMEQIANSHLRASLTELNDMLGPTGELIDWRDVNMSTGMLAGKKGNLTLQINLATTIAGDSPNWTEDEAVPYWGIQGLRATGNNKANGFVATTNYFMDRSTGTIGSLDFPIGTSNNPCQVIASGTNTTIAGLSTTNGLNTDFHLSEGYHHNQPNLGHKVKDSTDTTNKTNATAWGDQSLSQQTWKYMFNTANGDVGTAENTNPTLSTAVVGETQTWPIGTPITWANALTDLNITPASPESRTYKNWVKAYFAYNDFLSFKCGTFSPGSYNPSSPVTADMRTGTTRHYSVPGVGSGAYGVDFSLANKEGWASAVHGNTSGRLQSQNYTQSYQGVRLLIWLGDTEWTLNQILKWKTNIYKIYTEGWPA